MKNKFNKIIKKKKDDFIYINHPTPIHTPFVGSYWLILTSIIYFLEKYPNTGFPICKKFKNDLNDKNNLTYPMIYNELPESLYCLICGRIYWYNKKHYYISDNLKDCILNVKDKEIIFMYLAIYYDDGNSHASIIIIDNKKKEIERFETYGSSNENIDMDSKLEEHLKKLTKEIYKKDYKYNKPIDFQSTYDFQSISTEHLRYINEAKGFCVAWIFWYLEHKLLNRDIPSIKLVKKLKAKLLEEKKTILNSIRSYANKLDKFMVKKLLSYKIKKEDIYNLFNDVNSKDETFRRIFKELLEIQNIR